MCHTRLTTWIEAQNTCEQQNMTLSMSDVILEGHIRAASDFGDVFFLGLRVNEKVIILLHIH